MDKIIRKNSNSSVGSNGSGGAQTKFNSKEMNPQGIQLAIRTDLFDHGVFPLQGKITSSILVDTFTNLNLLSSIDYKIKLQNWVD